VEELQPNTWIKVFFNDFPKCDMLLNNHSEVFNSYILEATMLTWSAGNVKRSNEHKDHKEQSGGKKRKDQEEAATLCR
jgi:hypothetical protein